MSTITIHASCHCKGFNVSLKFPASKTPLKSSVCHCDSCRHVSGHAFGTFAVIPLPYSHTPSTKGLQAYKSSSVLTRWFCQNCGARCWNDDRSGGGHDEQHWEWELSIGLIDRVEVDGQVRAEIMDGLLDRVQMWVGDTLDGGTSVWINGGVLEGMDRRLAGRQSQVVSDAMLEEMKHKPGDKGDAKHEVSAMCHCQSVTFLVRREDMTEKFKVGLDACDDCRKVTGSEFTTWANVPTDSIRSVDGNPFDLQIQQLGKYSTSKGIVRHFCTTCGATAFYEEEGTDRVDFAAGLLRVEGIRAEDWLDWTKYGDEHVAYVKDSVDKSFVDKLVLGVTNSKTRI